MLRILNVKGGLQQASGQGRSSVPVGDGSKYSPLGNGSCEKIEIKFACGSPRPNGERGTEIV
jgi:hypothetical protein